MDSWVRGQELGAREPSILVGAPLVGGAAEGGLGKIIAELGLPGLVLIIWLALASQNIFGQS